VGLKQHAEHVPAVKPEEHAAMGHGEHAGHGAAIQERHCARRDCGN
jgi:hypothetical protein